MELAQVDLAMNFYFDQVEYELKWETRARSLRHRELRLRHLRGEKLG